MVKDRKKGQWIEEKMAKTKYNKRYTEITIVEIPKYPRVKRVKGSQELIARWRCGNKKERSSRRERKENVRFLKKK